MGEGVVSRCGLKGDLGDLGDLGDVGHVGEMLVLGDSLCLEKQREDPSSTCQLILLLSLLCSTHDPAFPFFL